LPNGIRLVTERVPHVHSVAVGVWLLRGSRHEPATLGGISHFIEHLLFKGSETRSARQIALEVDSIGGHLDAFTSKEQTCYYAKVLDEHLPVAIDLLSDLVLRPKFDPEELERERQVIVEEIRMVNDSPEELVYDLFSGQMYRGHALGRPIQGTEASVGALSRPRLVRYFRATYRPENLLIAAAGRLRHDVVARQVRKAFGTLKRGATERAAQRSPRGRGGVVRSHKKGLEQVHLVLGVPALPERHAGRQRLFVLNALLGGALSSRLFQKIREERGLAYSVYSSVQAFLDAGYLSIYAATSPEKAREALSLVLHELRDLSSAGASEEEVKVAKDHLKGGFLLSRESTVGRMSSLARQEIFFGRQESEREVLRGIDAVTARGVRSLASDLFVPKRFSLAAVGPIRGIKLDAGRFW